MQLRICTMPVRYNSMGLLGPDHVGARNHLMGQRRRSDGAYMRWLGMRCLACHHKVAVNKCEGSTPEGRSVSSDRLVGFTPNHAGMCLLSIRGEGLYITLHYYVPFEFVIHMRERVCSVKGGCDRRPVGSNARWLSKSAWESIRVYA